MNPLSTIINDNLQRFEETFVAPPPFEDQMYSWKTKPFRDFLLQSQLSIIQAMKEKVKDEECEAPTGHPAQFAYHPEWYKGYNKALSTLSNWLQEAEDLINNIKK